MRVKLTRRASRGLSDGPAPRSGLVDPPAPAGATTGALLTVGGAYVLYKIGLDPQRMTTLGMLATLAGLAYTVFDRK